ncbi:MAG: Ig-like domain-containing protein [Oscillospiraceae bacterium]|nr:Ig-like domain-containing protein [Oscillospiraceae bacterium]
MGFWKKSLLCLLMVACLLIFPVKAAENTVDYQFTGMDGSKVTAATHPGTVKLIIFTHLHTGHEDTLLATLLNADWLQTEGLSVIVVDWVADSVESLRACVQENGAQDAPITFCIDTGDDLMKFLDAAGLVGNAFSMPVSFLVDANGKVLAHRMGESSDTALRALLSGHIAGVSEAETVTLSVTGEQLYTEAFEVLKLLNQQRKANGLSALTMDKDLLEAAMLRAAETNVYYSHTRPNGTECYTAFPYRAGMLAENIAIGFDTAAEVMDGWMNSPGHRENILTQEFASVGIGVFMHNGVCSWVQLFSSAAATKAEAPADAVKTEKVDILQTHLTVKITPVRLMISPGTTGEIAFRVNNVEFTCHNVRLDGKNVTCHSDNTQVAKVDADGVVTAVAPGTAHITVTLAGTDICETVLVEVGEHNYEERIEKAPTCGETGIGRYVCTNCGDVKIEEIPKLNTHSWDNGRVTKEPTVESEGEKTFTCTVCAKTRTETLPKLPAPSPTEAPTLPATKAPAVPLTEPPTVETTAPTEAPTEATTAPTETTTMPAEATQMPTAAPTEMTQTAPSQTSTQPTTEPETQSYALPEQKLVIGIAVAVVATLAAGAFLIFWKRKD